MPTALLASLGSQRLQGTEVVNSRLEGRRWPTVLGLSLLAFYALWNCYWLATGRIPPSMLVVLTGLPAPTTGGTRSVLALLHGDLRASLYYNPMTIPIAALLTVTGGQMLFKSRRDGWLLPAWIAVLMLAWLLKLLSPTETW